LVEKLIVGEAMYFLYILICSSREMFPVERNYARALFRYLPNNTNEGRKYVHQLFLKSLVCSFYIEDCADISLSTHFLPRSISARLGCGHHDHKLQGQHTNMMSKIWKCHYKKKIWKCR
jgi:hypothetical protein